MFRTKRGFLCSLFIALMAIQFLLLPIGCDDDSSEENGNPGEPISREAPLSSMVAVQLDQSFAPIALLPSEVDSIPECVKSLVDEFARDSLTPGITFPLANTTDDTFRQIEGLRSNVVVSYLDPLTNDPLFEGPVYGAGNDYIAYFEDGWDSDWVGDVVGSGPEFKGSSTSGFLWSNFEFIDGFPGPNIGAAPVTTGAHITLANLLSFLNILSIDPLDDAAWTQDQLDIYIENWKRVVGGGYFRAELDSSSMEWNEIKRNREKFFTMADFG